MAEILRRELVYLWYYFTVQFEQIFPYWVLGMLLGSAVSVFAKGKIHTMMARLQAKRLGVLGVVPASILGIASPLCMYGTIPLAASFSQMGMRDDLLAAFMMSSILLNPQLIVYSAALGSTALTVRLVSCFFCGVVAGLLVRFFYGDKTFFDFSGFSGPQNRDTEPLCVDALFKKPGPQCKSNGILVSVGHCPIRPVSEICPGGSDDVAVRRQRSVRCANGGHCRRAVVRLRWRYHSAAPDVACRWYEHGQCRRVYADRTFHQNHQPGRRKDRVGNQEVSPISCLCDGVFFTNGPRCQCLCIKPTRQHGSGSTLENRALDTGRRIYFLLG